MESILMEMQSNPKKEILTEFLNVFLQHHGLDPICEPVQFSVDKSFLLKRGNGEIFSEPVLSSMSRTFDCFKELHDENYKKMAYLIIVLQTLVQTLSDLENIYKFNTKETCTITCTKNIVKIKLPDMCACLRNTEVRRDAREKDPECVCVCRLFAYRDQRQISHMSYGDDKIKGGFYFPDSDIVHQFILTGEFRSKYLFVEQKTETFQAYFDLDFKLHKHGLGSYLLDDRIEEVTRHIVCTICEELQNSSYVYCDKTLGQGVHLYFPNSVLNKKKLTEHVQNVTTKLEKINILGLSKKDNVLRRVYKLILDKCACHNGLALLFQEKANGSHYKINLEKSTYPNIPSDPIEQLRLTSLRNC